MKNRIDRPKQATNRDGTEFDDDSAAISLLDLIRIRHTQSEIRHFTLEHLKRWPTIDGNDSIAGRDPGLDGGRTRAVHHGSGAQPGAADRHDGAAVIKQRKEDSHNPEDGP